MALKTETLAPEIIDSLKMMQTTSTEKMLALGNIYLKIRELNTELKKLQKEQSDIESQFDENNLKLTEVIKDLEKTYPMGEVDLNQGIVIFEAAE